MITEINTINYGVQIQFEMFANFIPKSIYLNVSCRLLLFSNERLRYCITIISPVKYKVQRSGAGKTISATQHWTTFGAQTPNLS